MSEQDHASGSEDFDTELAAVERFISDVQQGSVPTGEAMRAYRDVHRPAIERLRTQLIEFEQLLDATGSGDAAGTSSGAGQASGAEGEAGSTSSDSA
jgi:hypothetical protein